MSHSKMPAMSIVTLSDIPAAMPASNKRRGDNAVGAGGANVELSLDGRRGETCGASGNREQPRVVDLARQAFDRALMMSDLEAVARPQHLQCRACLGQRYDCCESARFRPLRLNSASSVSPAVTSNSSAV